MLLDFIGSDRSGFEIWQEDHPHTPYKVVEIAQLEERVIAWFSLYDDALNFVEQELNPYGKKSLGEAEL